MPATSLSQDAIVALARQALDIEARALNGLSERLLTQTGEALPAPCKPCWRAKVVWW